MDNTATASATEQKSDVTAPAAQPAAAPASDQKPAAAAPATEQKSSADATKAEDPKTKSPVSTTKPTSLIGDAGKAQPNADGKKEGAEAGDGKKDDANKDGKKEAEPGKDGVPEKYEIKAPEGMTLNEAALAKFTPIAQKHNLTNETVQELANFYAAELQELSTAAESKQATDFQTFKDSTLKDTKDFFGTKLETVLPFVAKGRDQFANDGVMSKLVAAGLDNDKDFLLMFEKMGRRVSEDKLVDGKGGPTGKEGLTPGSIIYGKDKTT